MQSDNSDSNEQIVILSRNEVLAEAFHFFKVFIEFRSNLFQVEYFLREHASFEGRRSDQCRVLNDKLLLQPFGFHFFLDVQFIDTLLLRESGNSLVEADHLGDIVA